MPNWCSNVITINCNDDEELTKRLKESLDSEKDLFNQFVPQPKFENEEDWYWWNVENWGTKWDAKPYSIEWIDNDTVKFNIETAWGPCNKFLDEMVNLGYSVTSYYLEEGMAFCGCFEDGNDDYYDYGNMSVYDLPEWAEDIFGIVSRYEDEQEDEDEEEDDFDEDEDYDSELERTDWFPKKIKPVRVGTYEVMTKSWPFSQKCEWSGDQWEHAGNALVTQWRGITEKQYLEIQNEENSING
jgi:hypothetical protein